MRIIIKPYLEKMMKTYFPEYQLIKASGIFYMFRKKAKNGLYCYILFQREGAPYNQLVISECGIGYNKNWDGHPSNFIGATNSLAYLMSGNKPTSHIGWVEYGDTDEKINHCMQKLKRQIDTYVHPFFERNAAAVGQNEIYHSVVEVMRTELDKETADDLDEIKKYMLEGQKANSQFSIYDYKNYNRWYNLINDRLGEKVEFRRYIFSCLKDYLNYYY